MATFPIISIIIPVYNTEKYIRECLDSILAQTYTDWEAILVDDGSTDNSGKICDEYATKDKRIIVIHQRNGGVSSARLNGFKRSNGEWIVFLDSDDTLPNNSLSILIVESRNYDCICGAMLISECSNKRILYKEDIVIENEELARSIIKFERKFSWELPGKLIKHSLLDNDTLTLPKEITVFEDYIITLRYLKKAKNIKYISTPVYNYIQRVGSATHNNIFNLERVEILDKYISEACDVTKFKEERIKGQCQMLGWIIEDNQLNNKTEWFRALHTNSKSASLCRTDTLLIYLVRFINSGKLRGLIWKSLLKMRKILNRHK